MAWTEAASVIVDGDGRYVDADAAALELLGVESVAQLRDLAPSTFAAVPPDPEEQAAWQRAYSASTAEGVLAEVAFRRLDGELVRVRTAIMPEEDGTFRALFYPIERPTTNLAARVYRIADVLEEWRSAERRLVALDPAGPDAAALLAEIAALRDQYQRIFSLRHKPA